MLKLNHVDLHWFILYLDNYKLFNIPNDNIIIGVIDIIVIITIDAIINKHIVDIDKHDIKRFDFDFKPNNFKQPVWIFILYNIL